MTVDAGRHCVGF